MDEKKYLIFHSCLLQLFKSCPQCAGPSKQHITRPFGGMLIQVIQTCSIRSCSYVRRWRSQPMVGNVAAGNILLSAAILVSGVNIRKFINALAFINVAMITYSTFFIHQRRYFWICRPYNQLSPYNFLPFVVRKWKNRPFIAGTVTAQCGKIDTFYKAFRSWKTCA